MTTQKYSVNQHLIETLLTWVKSGEIAIPEIQRPFVWDASQVRDLLDSLYQGYPVGYIIVWKNPDVRLKDGSLSAGKKVLIDGQQRITALSAALVAQPVVNKDYKQVRIRIAFNPNEERFEVSNPAIEKNRAWIPDIAPLMQGEISLLKLIRGYVGANPEADEDYLERVFSQLVGITKKQIGMIELAAELDIETVTEIFIRINREGQPLSQADFAMSKIAANETYGGNLLRKAIDYFCHLAVAPEFYAHIDGNDQEFAKTSYFQAMRWLRHENDDLYDPSYSDMLRVAYTSKFSRGKLADLVALLSGRNFETKTYEDDIARQSFERLQLGVMEFMNETNFKRFLMIIKSAGFVDSSLIPSQSPLNFAYALFLKLRSEGYPAADYRALRAALVRALSSHRPLLGNNGDPLRPGHPRHQLPRLRRLPHLHRSRGPLRCLLAGGPRPGPDDLQQQEHLLPDLPGGSSKRRLSRLPLQVDHGPQHAGAQRRRPPHLPARLPQEAAWPETLRVQPGRQLRLHPARDQHRHRQPAARAIPREGDRSMH